MASVQEQQRLGRLAEELRTAFGGDLISVVLYGSAARGDTAGAIGSDLNVVVVIKDLSLDSLERGTRITRSWEESGNRPLLFLSPEWVARSCDVFPMEFLDIIESHRVISGPDPFAGLHVSHDNLRLQCEFELKTRLIHLRTGYMELHKDSGSLGRLLAASFAPVVAILRATLRIAGQPAGAHHDDVIDRVAVHCGLDPAPFHEVAALKRGGPRAVPADVKTLFKRYYAQVESLANAVDAGIAKGGA